MRSKPVCTRVLPPLLAGMALGLAVAGAWAQEAGEVEFARGVGFVQTPGQTPRTLGKGLLLQQGDRLTTSEGASAIIKLADGTRMTVRPNSELVLQQYQFKENAETNSMVMQLLRGGLRAVTGLISKGSANAAKIQTNTATIGIRGTDFDARVCTTDCGGEAVRGGETARPNAVQASAKIILVQGDLSAVDTNGQRRRLVDGGSVYPGDMVETGAATRAVLAFRDDTRVTLGSSTRFRVDNFVFDDKNPNDGRFLVSLLRGTVRALTGLIAKANTRNVGISTATATIGIRGTGLDATCQGPCETPFVLPGLGGPGGPPGALPPGALPPGAPGLPPAPIPQPGGGESGLTIFTWLGSVVVSQQGQPNLQVIPAGQGLVLTPAGARPIAAPPAFTETQGPRPDAVPVPPKLFTSAAVAENTEGLFVLVRDGHIEIATPKETLHLGKGESGFAGLDGTTARPVFVPRFMDFDKVTMPTSKNPNLVSLLGDSGVKTTSKRCQ